MRGRQMAVTLAGTSELMGGSFPGVPTHSEVSVFGMYLDAEKSWVVLVRVPRAAVEPLQARRPSSQEELKPT